VGVARCETVFPVSAVVGPGGGELGCSVCRALCTTYSALYCSVACSLCQDPTVTVMLYSAATLNLTFINLFALNLQKTNLFFLFFFSFCYTIFLKLLHTHTPQTLFVFRRCRACAAGRGAARARERPRPRRAAHHGVVWQGDVVCVCVFDMLYLHLCALLARCYSPVSAGPRPSPGRPKNQKNKAIKTVFKY